MCTYWKPGTKAAEEEIRSRDDSLTIVRQLEEAVDSIVQAAIEHRSIPESAYAVVHDTPGGIELLVGASFLFSLKPAVKHRLALAIKEEEAKRLEEWENYLKAGGEDKPLEAP